MSAPLPVVLERLAVLPGRRRLVLGLLLLIATAPPALLLLETAGSFPSGSPPGRLARHPALAAGASLLLMAAVLVTAHLARLRHPPGP